jgi:F420-non-reducing hydrogenase iron-sulfur subunit
MAAESTFEPRILGLLCNWCSYTAADAAGAAHHEYSPNVRIVRVMCTGRIDPSLVFKALAQDVDGVLICGCHPGDCHYVNGNCKALARFRLLERTLVDLGVESGRVRLEWVSASEGERLAGLIDEFTDQVRSLGPLSWPAAEVAGEVAAS